MFKTFSSLKSLIIHAILLLGILGGTAYACAPMGDCGTTPLQAGSDCPAGTRCGTHPVYGGFSCNIDERCPIDLGINECDPVGCDGGCGFGRRCTYDTITSKNVCTTDEENCSDTDPRNQCSAVGCNNGCGVGRKCVYVGGSFAGTYCVDAAPGECSAGESCTAAEGSCDPNCGPGMACRSGICVFDNLCPVDMQTVPYEGPVIESLGELFGVLYGILYPAAILLAGIMIIFAGYKLMTSEGNPQKVKEGQEDLTSAIVGGLFVILSAAILRIIIKSILGGDVNF